MRNILKYMKGFGKECVLSPLFKMLEAIFELLVPLVVSGIIDTGVGGEDKGYIIRMGIIMALLAVIGLACALTAQFFAAKAAVGFSSRLRHAVMEHLLHLNYTCFDQLGTSTMVTRLTSDINQVQNGVNLSLRLLLRSPFVVFGAMIMAFTIDARSALIFLGLIVLLCVVVFGITLITMPIYRRVQSNLDSVTQSTRENLAGVRVLRAFCMEDAQVAKFAAKTQALSREQQFAGRIAALLNPVTFVLVNMAIIVLIYTGALRVQAGLLTQGLVIALYNYMSQILVELIKMANLIITISKAIACGNRINAVLSIETKQENISRDIMEAHGAVELRNVAVKYSGAADVSLENISFSAQPGQTIGIIGGTGSGKTTLVNVISGFYDVTEGAVFIDGQDIREYTQSQLRKMIGIVPQKAVLFHGSIRENLLWGNPDATDEQIWEALEVAQAKDFVMLKDGQLDAPVEQSGKNFSYGQLQRLTIARALLCDPKILIMDDSASALDYATDAKLRQAIRLRANAPTTFIVSQRAASVRFCDLILVLDDGCLVGAGTHDILLETCSVYREIFHSQFSKEVAKHG